MKKVLKYFGIMIMVVLLGGCGKKEDPQKILDEAFSNMSEIGGMSGIVTFKIGVDYSGAKLSMDIVMDMDMDKEDDAHGTYKIGVLGYAEEMEMYVTTIGDYTYSYMKQPTGNWQYVKELSSKGNSQFIAKEDMMEMLESVSHVKKVKSDKKGYTKLEAQIDMAQFSDMFTEYGIENPIPEISEKADMVMNIYVKDGYVYIIECDMTDILNKLANEDPEQYRNSFTEVIMTMEYSNFNGIDDIVVPQEVIDNAELVMD